VWLCVEILGAEVTAQVELLGRLFGIVKLFGVLLKLII